MTTVATPVRGPAGRYPEIDVLKAAAILAVITIHSVRPFWLPDVSELEKLVLLATRFGVPAFLAASGFLYYSAAPIPFATIRRRLRRVVVPYCFVSIAALAYGAFYPARLTSDSLVAGLLLGAFFGPYYYVFLLVGFIFSTWVLSRLSTAVVTWLSMVALATVFVWESRIAEMWRPFANLWEVRNPLLWAGWWLLGWSAAAHRRTVSVSIARHRTAIAGGWIVYTLAWALGLGSSVLTGRPARASVVLLILATIIGLVAVGSSLRATPRWLAQLSDWTYSLYLLHPFCIYFVQDTVAPALGWSPAVWVPLSAVAGFAGSLAVTMAGRRLLGAWSRDIIGA